jgi:serine protease Do
VVRAGRVLQVRDGVLQTDCTIVAGDSGGPVVDLDAKVIGINSRINAGVPTMNFHVPIDAFHQSWDRLVKGEVLQTTVLGKDSNEVKGVFGPVMAEAGRCVVRVKCDGREVALGTIVGPDGWIVTKASQLKGRTLCRTLDGQEREARLVGVHEGFDLAMLKIEVSGLPVLPWAGGQQPAVGQWVATLGAGGDRPLAVGVLGVPPRRIPPISGALGVELAEQESPPRIRQVFPGSAAQKAGLQENDVITHLNDKPTNTRAELIAAIKQHRPGTKVKVTAKRGDKTLEVAATLARLQTPDTRKRDMQNLGGPGVSARADDFPKVLQHDTVVVPNDCGGPLLDLSGRVIGVNIARAGRTETYAVPADVLLGLMYDLMSGRLAPAKPQDKPSAQPSPPKPADQKPETKPAEPKPGEPKPAAPKPAEPKPPEPKPAEPKPAQPQPPQPPQPKPADAKPQEPKPKEAKPQEPKPAESKPAEPKPADAKPAAPKPPEPEKKPSP